MKLIFADLETTGTDPTRHHLWELALIVREDGRPDNEYCWQIRPDLTTADPMALKIGRYYERPDVFEILPVGGVARIANPHGVDASDVLADVARDVAVLLNGAVLAAANVAFDRDFLGAFLRANGQALACDYHLLEIESYAAGAFGIQPPWKLDRLLEMGGVVVSEEDRHSALGDARAVRDLYDAVRSVRGGRA